MRKLFLYPILGVLLGLGAPLGALFLLWFSPHPALQLPDFIVEEWRDHLFFFCYMLAGTSLAFALFGFFLGRSADIIEANNRHLSLLATQDELTGLGNHRFLHETFKVEFRRHLEERKPLSCLMMDLDHFKKVNDTYGHPFGDYVLKHVGALIKKSIRSGDIPARYGGEEFFCILPRCNVKEAREVAERIRVEIEGYSFLNGDKRVPVTISIGIATSSNRSDGSYHHLGIQADHALYEAKRLGRNRIVQWVSESRKSSSKRASKR